MNRNRTVRTLRKIGYCHKSSYPVVILYFQALPQEVRDELTRDRVTLEKLIKYHIAIAPQTCDQLRNNEDLGTLDSTKKIVIKEYASVSKL